MVDQYFLELCKMLEISLKGKLNIPIAIRN